MSLYTDQIPSPDATLVVFFTVALNVIKPIFPAYTFGTNILLCEPNPPGLPTSTPGGFDGKPVKSSGVIDTPAGKSIAT